MALPAVKYDDGTSGFASNCFPVRTLVSQSEEAYGAWFVAHRAEQKRRFKAFVCSKPRTYDEIRDQRKQAEKDGTAIVPPVHTEEDEEDNRILDGFFLMKHCCVEDPSDLCSINVNAQNLSEAKGEDFPLFDNVAYVNASENILPFECFKYFPIIRELEMSLNGLRSLKIDPGDFPHLEMLDLSFNNLSCTDILTLGLLPNLKVLHLTGNNLKTLPLDMARPHLDEKTFDKVSRFKTLEILLLDDNSLSEMGAFAALAGLRRLKHLNLAKNGIQSVPQLMLVEGRHVTQDSDALKSKGRHRQGNRRHGNRTSSRSSLASISSRQSNVSTPTHRSTENLTRSRNSVRRSKKNSVADVAQRPASKTDLQGDGQQTHADIPPQMHDGQPMHAETTQTQNDTLGATASLGDLGTLSDLKLDDLQLPDLDPSVFESLGDLKVSGNGGGMVDGKDRSCDAFERPGYTGEEPLPLPFPELRHLNLAHNKISDEECLLAVAAWPMLAELVIHDNPLTTQTSGDPPILKRFLTDRLGIKLHRKKVPPLIKPHIEVPDKQNRKVLTRILPVPRCDVDKLLALEAPPPASSTPDATDTSARPQPQPGNHGDRMQQQPLDPSKPIPPIPSGQIFEEEEEEDEEEIEVEKGPAFFMTQVDEQPTTSSRRQTPTSRASVRSGTNKQQQQLRTESSQQTATTSRHRRTKDVPDKYKGYEALLDIDSGNTAESEDAVIQPQDLPGNIRALQYALSHPLVFRDNAPNLCAPQPPYRPYVKGAKVPATRPRKTRAEKVDAALGNLRERETVVEKDLKAALEDRSNHKESHEAQKLLAQVQRRYNAVRASSMKGTRELIKGQRVIKDTLTDVQKHFAQTSA